MAADELTASETRRQERTNTEKPEGRLEICSDTQSSMLAGTLAKTCAAEWGTRSFGGPFDLRLVHHPVCKELPGTIADVIYRMALGRNRRAFGKSAPRRSNRGVLDTDEKPKKTLSSWTQGSRRGLIRARPKSDENAWFVASRPRHGSEIQTGLEDRRGRIRSIPKAFSEELAKNWVPAAFQIPMSRTGAMPRQPSACCADRKDGTAQRSRTIVGLRVHVAIVV